MFNNYNESPLTEQQWQEHEEGEPIHGPTIPALRKDPVIRREIIKARQAFPAEDWIAQLQAYPDATHDNKKEMCEIALQIFTLVPGSWCLSDVYRMIAYADVGKDSE